MPYSNCKIYGPYARKVDGREHVIAIDSTTGKRTTVSYPKYLMELKLGYKIKNTVHHVDGDFTNNKYSNLMILERSKHVSNDVIRNKQMEFICPNCSKKIYLEEKRLRYAISNRKRGKSGPFCNRKCAGKYGKDIQNNKRTLVKVNLITPEKVKNSS